MALNMTHLDMTEEWAKEPRMWSLKDIYATVAEVAVALWPHRCTPRNFTLVMDQFIQRMDRTNGLHHSIHDKMYKKVKIVQRWIVASLNDLVDIIYRELLAIDEFRKWNLTELEYQHGVDPDSNDRYKLWDQYKGEFVDLDAFKQNVYCALRSKLIEEHFWEDEMK